MKVVLTPFALLFCLLTGRFNFLFADAAASNQNQLTEYELNLDTRTDTDNCKYMKVSVDGLQSHMLFSNSNSVANKVMDGTTQVWVKQGDDKCIGALLTYKGTEKMLLMLVVMKKLAMGTDPLDTLFYKFENNQWQTTDKNGFYQAVKANRPDTSSTNPEDMDISDSKNGSELLSAADCPIGFGLRLFLPKQGQKIANLIDGTHKIVEGTNGEYPLYFLLGKKGDNNKVKKFGIGAIRTNGGYEDRFYKFDNNKWKSTDYSGIITYIIKSAGFSMLRGNGKSKSN